MYVYSLFLEVEVRTLSLSFTCLQQGICHGFGFLRRALVGQPALGGPALGPGILLLHFLLVLRAAMASLYFFLN